MKRHLLDPVYEGRFGEAGDLEDGFATSMMWWNWLRCSPLATNPLGQWTTAPFRVPPKCEATCLVHWYGVSMARAQPTA